MRQRIWTSNRAQVIFRTEQSSVETQQKNPARIINTI